MQCGYAKLYTIQCNVTNVVIYVYYNVTIRYAYHKVTIFTDYITLTIYA